MPDVEVAVAAEFGEPHSKLGDYRLHMEDGQLGLTACLVRGIDNGMIAAVIRVVTAERAGSLEEAVTERGDGLAGHRASGDPRE